MRKKTTLPILLVFLCSLLFSTNSFAENTEITTYSPYCILMESSTKTVLYEKNANKTTFPASTTKIMTAILTIENCKLTDTAVVSANAVNSIPASYTTAYLVEGEILTIEQLLNLLLIPSANDAAIVLAEHISGSVEAFSTKMNEKALEIGCTNTNFVNPNGIHSDKHYSTAYDLALMGRYAMQFDIFRKIVLTMQYTIPSTNKVAEANRTFHNTNALLYPDESNNSDNYYFPYTTGIKTGYTNPAKDCIVASCKKDDLEYIVVILGADETNDNLSSRYLDCKNLFTYATENFTICTIKEKDSIISKIPIPNINAFNQTLDVIVQDDITALIRKDIDVSTLNPNIELLPDLTAPILTNTVVGTISYCIDDITYSSNIIAASNVVEVNMFTSILTIVSIIIIFVLLYHLLSSDNMKRK